MDLSYHFLQDFGVGLAVTHQFSDGVVGIAVEDPFDVYFFFPCASVPAYDKKHICPKLMMI